MWGAIIGAGIGAASSLFGAAKQNEAAEEAASAQMAHQIAMYQNRYQWQMEDMRKAGLNPILAYRQGAPGGGAGASYTPVNVGAAGVQGAASAMQSYQASRQADLLKAQEGKADAEKAVAVETAKQVRDQNALTKLNVASAAAEHDRARHEQAFWNTEAGRKIAEMGAINKAVPGLGIAGAIAKAGISGIPELIDLVTGKDRTPHIVSRPRGLERPKTFTKKQKEKISQQWRDSSYRYYRAWR